MSVFLILSSLGVAFYLVLLYNLYREGRERRRQRVDFYREMDFGDVSGPASAGPNAAVAGRSLQFSDEVLWLPVTKMKLKPVLRPRQPRPEPLRAAMTDQSVRQVKCG